MLSESERDLIARALVDAERDLVYIPPLTESHPGSDIDDAYAIALRVTAIKLASGRRVRGHKIGITSPAMREVAGADEPDFGHLFDDWFVPEGSSISFARRNNPFVEMEIAFVLRRDLDGPSVNAADVIRATDFVLPAIEIVDRRYLRRGPGPLVVDSVADAAWCGCVVLGGNPRRLDQLDVRAVKGTLSKNGEVCESGVSSEVMGNPVNAVAWLANKLHQFGVGLEAGHVVLSGSFIKTVPFVEGDIITATLDGLGDVSFEVGP